METTDRTGEQVDATVVRTGNNNPSETARALLEAYVEVVVRNRVHGKTVRDYEEGVAVLDSPPAAQIEVIHLALERVSSLRTPGGEPGDEEEAILQSSTDTLTYTRHTTVGELRRRAYGSVLDVLCQRSQAYTPADVERLLPQLLERVSAQDLYEFPLPQGLMPSVLKRIEELGGVAAFSPEVRELLTRLRNAVDAMRFYAGFSHTVTRLDILLGRIEEGMPEPGERWSDRLIADVKAMPEDRRAAWLALLKHAPVANQAAPSKTWMKRAPKLLEAVGAETFARTVEPWLDLVGRPASAAISDLNKDVVKGLVWFASMVPDSRLASTVTSMASACFANTPAGGLVASRIGKACLYALSRMGVPESLSLLSRLKREVRSPWALEEIRKAMDAYAERSGQTREDLEELLVPTFGIDEHAILRSSIGAASVGIDFQRPKSPAWSWLEPGSKARATVPPAVQKQQSDALKTLKKSVSEIQKFIAAQSDRLEGMLLSDRSWDMETWRERYVDHPLVGIVARRLIWSFSEGEEVRSGIWRDGSIVGMDGNFLAIAPDATVRLWHPLGADVDVVVGWRIWLEQNQVTQPFKQAHREVYLLTDAEIATRTYSNRFAGHIVKQHQFHALCQLRGWKHEFLGRWDSDEGLRATLMLPQWDLRAELWVEGAGVEGEELVSDAGVLLYVSTDQVRFFRGRSPHPMPLAEVPALVFSEVMRDVDLFVSVSSIGADPAWRDHGEVREFDGYWQSYSFGDLGVTAQTRRDILERLLPRLKIADRCELAGRYLRVRGELRTYKIHLGSGNVLMEPNDQYLCIVQDRKMGHPEGGSLFLPFEGDSTLSVILSKAFLLADDTKITDPTILRQLNR